MGNSEDGKVSMPEKSSSPAMDQHNIHVFPDWTKMQAYYGPRLAVPPYLNSAVTSGHAPPPYMWGPPQAIMPPYGPPYAAFYAHGSIYAHPGVPIAGTPLSMDTQTKSSENTDGSLLKKLKEFNGLAMSIGNGNADSDSAEGGSNPRLSKSGETGDSSDESNGITAGVGHKGKKRSREETPNNAVDSKAQTHNSLMDMVVPEKAPENVSTALELKDLSYTNVKSVPTKSPQPPLTNEAGLHNDRDLKRERRKQSNRESARRSRLRKQAEAGELATKVQMLTHENLTLKSEIHKLLENSDMLKVENATLMEKLKDAQLGQTEISLHKIDDPRLKPIGTANLLSRVNNSDRKNESDTYENKSSGTKLRQLLDASLRTDAVAAS
ncbi:common plant regulatory factor 1-like isoform X1 [Olea europaea var. sylvestris]|uniref:common plant regulatory factor 1-like isoform X1 n=1 Tax=Olea europaea var. sylvestris TaxID=158386 RepID=UPI000C1CDDB4|nr:common plant regulatory factor 1-like isoform X1 [Olea europaea var. sylvestris]XP_022871309.1 common plant regulatory factor 1-like isoform X1 [Olea europaea var. sylvestris]XP_022871315.1 common plant regulatory factor 1-like isoform X1 [Olea europaea var. sylvestris]XP_022871323.1 common plant regulatory factor 1-like isoform X1 [Olea europaea var. sylvestris]XP_022871331.1 common plant regulatory factor 1-like isoform X1 [Olea europaea var. sylvestris]